MGKAQFSSNDATTFGVRHQQIQGDVLSNGA